jgi:hypothetical protein
VTEEGVRSGWFEEKWTHSEKTIDEVEAVFFFLSDFLEDFVESDMQPDDGDLF